MCIKILGAYSTITATGKFVITKFDSIIGFTVTSVNNTVSEFFFMVSGEMLRVYIYIYTPFPNKKWGPRSLYKL